MASRGDTGWVRDLRYCGPPHFHTCECHWEPSAGRLAQGAHSTGSHSRSRCHRHGLRSVRQPSEGNHSGQLACEFSYRGTSCSSSVPTRWGRYSHTISCRSQVSPLRELRAQWPSVTLSLFWRGTLVPSTDLYLAGRVCDRLGWTLRTEALDGANVLIHLSAVSDGPRTARGESAYADMTEV